ncbi:hypothetical protein SapgrDRAFT_3331 [Saprospira grandis DSM 2844]|uniref:Uncharacterized protein n=1 Tax=Saprospira grandis DSM 2844 TaxID=694433 RepID=J0P517_9BACT|nr:hypothetical protein [Saprospira grandis]EJF54974.1 hypothetical protein SapgrDRAFT_3331 [Saprospira grandis DSM 2844]
MKNLLYPEVKYSVNSATGNQIAALLNRFFYRKKQLTELKDFYTDWEKGKASDIDGRRYVFTVSMQDFIPDSYKYKKDSIDAWDKNTIKTIAGNAKSYIDAEKKEISLKLLKLVCPYAAYVHWFGKGESKSVEYIVEIDTSKRRFIKVVEVNGTQDDYRVGTIFKLNKNCSDV